MNTPFIHKSISAFQNMLRKLLIKSVLERTTAQADRQ